MSFRGSQFFRKIATGRRDGFSRLTLSGDDVISGVDDGNRVVTYILSTEEVARDNHRIRTAGFKLDNFKANPVLLWAHDAAQPPIGRFSDIWIDGDKLLGAVVYADRETYEFADTIYRLVKDRMINAVSVSWNPIRWKYSTDPKRPGGIDFLEQDLLEVSQVPLPCLPSALAIARSAGIDTGPIARWAEKTYDEAKSTWSRGMLARLYRAAKSPAPKQESNMAENSTREKPKHRAIVSSLASARFNRDLYACGWLASIVSSLKGIYSDAKWEAEYEGDDSPVPGQLADALKTLGGILIAMTAEEVGELLAALPDGVAESGDIDDAGAMAHAASIAMAHARKGLSADFPARAGRTISANTARCMRDACDMHAAAIEQHQRAIGKTDEALGIVQNRSGVTADDTAPIADAQALHRAAIITHTDALNLIRGLLPDDPAEPDDTPTDDGTADGAGGASGGDSGEDKGTDPQDDDEKARAKGARLARLERIGKYRKGTGNSACVT
jgi:phage head maturation protease